MQENNSTLQTLSLEQQLLNATYRVQPDPFWTIRQMRGDDGYDRIEAASKHAWHAIPSWGLNGWDLGSWPYSVIFHRHTAAGYDLAENTEGDVAAYRYPTRELLYAATDCLAFFHWKHDGESWVDGIDSVDVAPPNLRGAFSWKRLNGAKEQAS